jgi:hypothetical protein
MLIMAIMKKISWNQQKDIEWGKCQVTVLGTRHFRRWTLISFSLFGRGNKHHCILNQLRNNEIRWAGTKLSLYYWRSWLWRNWLKLAGKRASQHRTSLNYFRTFCKTYSTEGAGKSSCSLWPDFFPKRELVQQTVAVPVQTYLFIVVVGFKLKDLCLLGRCSTTWATLPALIWLFVK